METGELNPCDTIFERSVQTGLMAFGTGPFKGNTSKYISYRTTFIAPQVAFLAVKVSLLFREVLLLVLGVIERNPSGTTRRIRRELRVPVTE